MIAKSKAVIWFAFFFQDGQSIEIIKSELSQEYPLQEVLYQGESITDRFFWLRLYKGTFLIPLFVMWVVPGKFTHSPLTFHYFDQL